MRVEIGTYRGKWRTAATGNNTCCHLVKKGFLVSVQGGLFKNFKGPIKFKGRV
jgi:hypothetical protein